jgi:hypothetical protein
MLTPEIHGQKRNEVIREPNAVAILQRSLAAMRPAGQAADPDAISSVIVTGTMQRPSAGAETQGTFTFTDSFLDGNHHYRKEMTSGDHTTRLTSNEGEPKRQDNGNSSKQLSRVMHAYYGADHVPYSLIAEAVKSPSIGIRIIKAARVGNADILQIETTQENKAAPLVPLKRDWYIDAQTSLPIASCIIVPTISQAPLSLLQTTKYSAYKQFDGLINPTDIVVNLGTREVVRLNVTSVQINANVAHSSFASTEDSK